SNGLLTHGFRVRSPGGPHPTPTRRSGTTGLGIDRSRTPTPGRFLSHVSRPAHRLSPLCYHPLRRPPRRRSPHDRHSRPPASRQHIASRPCCDTNHIFSLCKFTVGATMGKLDRVADL